MTEINSKYSLTSTLPVYIDAYDLLKYVIVLIKNLPRDIKFIYGTDLKDNVFQLVANIYFANTDKQNRLKHINKSLANIKFIHLMVRVSRDLNFITDKQYIAVINLTGKINKQLNAWKRSQNTNR